MEVLQTDSLEPQPPPPMSSPEPSPSPNPLLVVETTVTDPTMSIIKNSTIPVNVDDLGPGLIIATYIHSNGSLYQGVLLQLNRERGIPCGISFPKDYCSMIPSRSNEFEIESSENEQQPPVSQRHTYFQNTSSVQKPLRRFNRATKPPARYKNGRLALRFRHRPILCSKCKAYCEEKNPNPPKGSENGNSLAKGSGTSTRKNQPKNKIDDQQRKERSVIEMNFNGVCEEAMEDYAFSVAGPIQGLVENYWKRPTPVAPMDLDKNPHSRKTEEKNPKSTTTNSSFKSFTSLKNIENNQVTSTNTGVHESEKEESSPPEFRAKKQNLKLCINKLRIQKQSLLIAQEDNQSTSEPNVLDEAECESSVYKTGIREIFETPIQRRVTRELSLNPTGKSRTKKRSSTVPARFRDETCITKNVFNFKKRSLTNKDLGPCDDTTTTIPLSEEEATESSDSSPSSNSLSSRKVILTSKVPPLSLKSEVSRTPTIKISFGSSGKGEVLEIPSKPTIESSPEDPPSPLKSKAEKRALRKARKEAKRQLSKEPEEPFAAATSSLNTTALSILSNSHEFSSSQSSCSSPPPPLLTPISDFCPPVIDEEFGMSLDQHCPPLIHFTNEIPLTPKKRKKEKKHKKYKVRKEDEKPTPGHY